MTLTPKLIKRIVSALVIAPIFLYVVITGGTVFGLWLLIAFLLSLYEWYGLAKRIEHFLPVMVWGGIYLAISYSSFMALREVYSVNILFLFLGMIWFSDIGAYFVGKIYGGPKLIQHISPNKTWSGFGGAFLAPALFAFVWGAFAGTSGLFNETPWYLHGLIVFVLGAVIGSTGQAGDLLISFIKRQANVKDTGTLIPGHGGLLDRIDSMLLGAPVFLILITLLSYVF